MNSDTEAEPLIHLHFFSLWPYTKGKVSLQALAVNLNNIFQHDKNSIATILWKFHQFSELSTIIKLTQLQNFSFCFFSSPSIATRLFIKSVSLRFSL